MSNWSFGRIKDRHRRGVAAPLLAIGLTTLLIFAALAVDIGYVCDTASELQRTCDVSALAGAGKLMVGNAMARYTSIQYANRNPVAKALVTDNLNAVVGNWNGGLRTFTPFIEGSSYYKPNAVDVTGARRNLGLFFARVMGVNSTNLQREAIAVAGAGTCAGIWGLEGVHVGGNIQTDSYDSQVGTYGPGNMNPNGDICSCRNIEINGSVEIRGDAMYGYGYAFIPRGTAWGVWGIIDDNSCGQFNFDADFEAAAADNDNNLIDLTALKQKALKGGNLRLTSDDSLTLVPGTYYFGSITIVGQGTIYVTGPTTIYVTGSADFGGGAIVNVTQIAANLLIYAAGSDLKMAGTSDFYGAIVAPNTDVILQGDNAYYGTILAQTLDFGGNPRIHVDERMVFSLFGLDPVVPVLVK